MNDYFGFDGVDDKALRKEKARARELRKSRWWKQKIVAGLCHYCGEKKDKNELTMDHLVPLARGGRSTRDNLVCACRECNTKKKTMLPMEWEEYMEQLRPGSVTK